MKGTIKLKKLRLPAEFRSTIAENLRGESHRSIFEAEVCGDGDTDCTHCFHRRTECFTLTNVENGSWVLMSQLFAHRNQSLTRIVVSVLAR